jgi:hypothetical protein
MYDVTKSTSTAGVHLESNQRGHRLTRNERLKEATLYPNLSRLAIDVLSILASSCYCERMFSEVGTF